MAKSNWSKRLTGFFHYKNISVLAIELLEDLVLRLHNHVSIRPLFKYIFDWTYNVLLVLGDLLGKAGQEFLELGRGEPGQHCDLATLFIESRDLHGLPSPQLG